jgi:uncharacterized protein YlxW (UPF0749 family)
MGWRASSVGVCLGLLVTIAGCGDAGDDQAKQRLTQARAQIRVERQAAQRELDTISQEVSDEKQTLADYRAKVADYRAKLARERRKLHGARAQVAKNTIAGHRHVRGRDGHKPGDLPR